MCPIKNGKREILILQLPWIEHEPPPWKGGILTIGPQKPGYCWSLIGLLTDSYLSPWGVGVQQCPRLWVAVPFSEGAQSRAGLDLEVEHFEKKEHVFLYLGYLSPSVHLLNKLLCRYLLYPFDSCHWTIPGSWLASLVLLCYGANAFLPVFITSLYTRSFTSHLVNYCRLSL